MSKGLDQLAPLVGEWSSSSKTYPEGRGRMTVAPTAEGKFLRIDSRIEDERFPQSTQIIGSDDASDDYTVLYYDSRGVYRVYRMSLIDRQWKSWRNAPRFNQRYSGQISEDGRTITGRWEMSEDGKHWKVDFDLNYEKVAG